MSDLWRRCSLLLQERLGPDDWRRSIEPLRAWVANGTIYLWVDRPGVGRRAIANPAKDFDLEIREVVGQIHGRGLTVRYLDRPPNRESMIGDRRTREFDARERSDARLDALRTFLKEEWLRIVENPPRRRWRSDVEMLVELDALAMERAKERLEREGLHPGSLAPAWRRGKPPVDPPPWPPPTVG
jgi:hypothetical protein